MKNELINKKQKNEKKITEKLIKEKILILKEPLEPSNSFARCEGGDPSVPPTPIDPHSPEDPPPLDEKPPGGPPHPPIVLSVEK